jgi:hypothetical protein
VSPTTGSTFTVTITSQASVPMSGASAALDFDKGKLQIISVTKGTGWNVAGSTWQVPSVGAIATANSTGHLPSIAAYFTDGSSSLPASTPTTLATVSFFAYAAGSAPITISATGGDAAAIIDGTTGAAYGSPVVTTVGANTSVTISGTAAAGQVTGNITGSVAAPTLALTCPQSVVVPLVRNTTNEAPFTCNVASDGAWSLSVKDTNPDANHGRLVDSSQVPVAVLANPLILETSQVAHNLAGAPDLFPVFAGQQNVAVPLTFKQVVAPADKPGAYAMSVLFSIVNSF